MRRAAFLLVVVAAVAVPAPGSGASGSARLALMPLAKSDLGPDAIALPLDPDSGVQSSADAARDANGKVTAAQLTALGRVTGYALDYSDSAGKALVAGRGLLRVQTGVERYRSAAAARKALAFWRRDEADLTLLRASGVKASERFFTPAGLRGPSFGMSGSATVSGKPPIYGVDVDFVQGDLVGKVSVAAADAASRRAYADGLAVKLAARIAGVLAGRIGGAPVPLPGKLKAGPPPNGPDLAALALTPADLGQVTVVKTQGYTLDRNLSPLSAYKRFYSPAGVFLTLQEEVALFHSATEASFTFATFASGIRSPALFAAYGGGLTFTDLKTVPVHAGDEAAAVTALARLPTGQTVLESIAVVRVGPTMEMLAIVDLPTMTISRADLQTLAAAAAKRAAAGLHR